MYTSLNVNFFNLIPVYANKIEKVKFYYKERKNALRTWILMPSRWTFGCRYARRRELQKQVSLVDITADRTKNKIQFLKWLIFFFN